MANPEKYPPELMAQKFGIGKLTRHLFVCLGPDCIDSESGEKTWDYLKKRLKSLNLAARRDRATALNASACASASTVQSAWSIPKAPGIEMSRLKTPSGSFRST